MTDVCKLAMKFEMSATRLKDRLGQTSLE